MAAAQRDVFPFFRLARELRDQICEEADAPLRIQCAEAYLNHDSAVTLTNTLNLGLLLANKQTRSEYLAARSRRAVTQRLVIQINEDCKPLAPVQFRGAAQRTQQEETRLRAIAKQFNAVKCIDIHFVEEDCPLYFHRFVLLSRLFKHIVPHWNSCPVSLIMHKDILQTPLQSRLEVALRIFDHAMMGLLNVSTLSQAGSRAARINASVLILMPLFTPYTCNVYSGLDPDGRIPDLIKNHKQNQILVEMQKSGTQPRFLDPLSLPFCTPGSYHQIEKEILEGSLEVYEKERDVEELVADLKAVCLGSKWVVDPLDYAEYVDGRE